MPGITWTELYTKAQRLSRDNNADTLVQIKQDVNTGYGMFNARFGRYFIRKQQFTSLVAQQQIYQIPIDCIRVMGITTLVTATYQPPVKEIVSEFEWRQITSYPVASNWPTYYFMIGNDLLSLWPVPSQSVTNGLRFYYQPRDHDLSVDDVTSTSTGFTVTVTNGTTTVTATGSAFNADMASLYFQVTGVTDNTWYEIVSATATTLTLKTPYVATSGGSKAWRVGQLSILPPEYNDVPMHYALANFFSAAGNEDRSAFHQKKFDYFMDSAEEEYSSSNSSNVITGDELLINVWSVPPIPG